MALDPNFFRSAFSRENYERDLKQPALRMQNEEIEKGTFTGFGLSKVLQRVNRLTIFPSGAWCCVAERMPGARR